jgi:hypothetical protein
VEVYYLGPSTIMLDYNDVYGNSANYNNLTAGAHDMSVDPQFIGSGSIFNHYHIQSSSPVSVTGLLAVAPPVEIDTEPGGPPQWARMRFPPPLPITTFRWF